MVLNVSDVSAATGNNSTTLNSQGATPVSPQVKYTPSEVNTAASNVKNFYETNNRLPSYVTVGNTQVTMPQFLHLLAADIVQANSGSTTSITLRNVGNPSNPSGTAKSGTLTKSEYVSLAQTVKNTIESTGKAPDNVDSSLGKIRFESLVYIFSKVMNFYKTNGRLPNTLTVPVWNGATQITGSTTSNNSQNNGNSNGATNTIQVTFTLSQINTAANSVKSFYETNNRLPSYVTVGNTQVTMPQFLHLLAADIVQANSGSTTSITLRNVGNPSNPSGTAKSGTLTKSEYVSLAQTVKNTIESTGKAPDNVDSSLGKIRFESLVYIFSKVMNFYKTNGRLPNTLTVPGSTTTTTNGGNGGNGTTSLGHGQLNGLQGLEGLEILAAYINKNLNHQYGAATTAEGVERTGLGDCWGLSAWTAQVLHDNGYTVRIVQGASVEASNHRWVQVLINGSWINFDPSLVTKKYGSQPYYTTCATVSQIIATYT